MCFEFRVRHFDRGEVGRVRRQEEQPIALGLQDVLCVCGLVGRQVIGDHHITRLQPWGQLGLDIEVERGAVHGTIQHPGDAEFVDP